MRFGWITRPADGNERAVQVGPRGYREIGDYNSNPSANRWFEKAVA